MTIKTKQNPTVLNSKIFPNDYENEYTCSEGKVTQLCASFSFLPKLKTVTPPLPSPALLLFRRPIPPCRPPFSSIESLPCLTPVFEGTWVRVKMYGCVRVRRANARGS